MAPQKLKEKANERNQFAASSKPKRKKTTGQFRCPDCDKIFTRSDHLARHHLNHAPKEVYVCDFIIEDFQGVSRKCGKSFVRKDLKERHYKRHLEGLNKDSKRVSSKIGKENLYTEDLASSPATNGVDTEYRRHFPRETFNDNRKTRHSSISSGKNSLSNHLHSPSNNYYALGNLNDETNSRIQHTLDSNLDFDQGLNFEYKHILSPQQDVVPSPSQQPYDPVNFHKQSLLPVNNMSLNDILSWLFTDSPPDNHVTFEKPSFASNQSQRKNSSKSVSQLTLRNPDHGSVQPFEQKPVSASHSPSLQIPHGKDFNNIRIDSDNLHYQNNNSVRSPFNPPYSYDLQDINIFLNNDNPLDDFLLKQSSLYPSTENINTFNSTLSYGNTHLTLGLLVSSTSPSTTIDSYKSPDISSEIAGSPVSNDDNRLVDLSKDSQILNIPMTEFLKAGNTSRSRHFFVDQAILNNMMNSVPSISFPILRKLLDCDSNATVADRFAYFIHLFWTFWHPQFPILHRPSFTTSDTMPLLLLSMVVVGCCHANDEVIKDSNFTTKELKIADSIATPLRYMIFQHEDFKSPVKLWVLQSLNILEWAEKNKLLRRMHERAHIHHGTTVQLLRRSPLLGGNPSSVEKKVSGNGSTNNTDESDSGTNNETDDDNLQDHELFQKWVESESMKRITFLTFYFDIIDYLKFRHDPQIQFYQMQQLNLPCDEDLWEYKDMNGSFKKIVKRQRKLQHHYGSGSRLERRVVDWGNSFKVKSGENFLTVLKNLLKTLKLSCRRNPDLKLHLSVFSIKMVFAGLVSIMHQMQLADLQSRTLFLEGSRTNTNNVNYQITRVWKGTMAQVFDNFNFEMGLSCCSSDLNVLSKDILSIHSKQCYFPMYHLVQIIGMADINHYDIAIFGGSPANQNVSATNKDLYVVQNKLKKIWATMPVGDRNIEDVINFESIIHSYLVLWEVMLDPSEAEADEMVCKFIDFNVNRDYFDSMYAIGISTLVLWSYVFTHLGIESRRYSDVEGGENLNDKSYESLVKLSAEGGYQYLSRIRQEFLTNLRKTNLHKDYCIHPYTIKKGSPPPHVIILKYCEIFPLISNKQNISGLCFLVGTKLLQSQWEIIRESAKLIINCGLRSVGKQSTICLNVFD